MSNYDLLNQIEDNTALVAGAVSSSKVNVNISSGTISGSSVSVTNFPATQPVSGTVNVGNTPDVTLSSGVLTSITNSVVTTNADATSMLANFNSLSDWNVVWRYTGAELFNLAGGVNNSGKNQTAEIAIAGSAPIKAAIAQAFQINMAATSEWLIQTRFHMGNWGKFIRWDFNIALDNGFSDDSTTFYCEFGIRNTVGVAHTNASKQKRVSIKLYKTGSPLQQTYEFRFGNSSINSNTGTFNIQNTNLPTSIYNFNRWSILVSDLHPVAVFGFWIKNVFVAIHYYSWQFGNVSGNGNLFGMASYKPFIHIYNNTANNYVNNLVDFAAYTPGPNFAINHLNSPYKIFTTDFFTFTTATSMNPMCYIQNQDNSGVHFNIQTPIAIVFNFYVTGGLVGEIQIQYASDNSQTLSGSTNFMAFIIQPARALVAANGTFGLASLYGPGALSYTLPNAYQYLGENDSFTNKPSIFLQALTLVSAGSIVYSISFYTM